MSRTYLWESHFQKYNKVSLPITSSNIWMFVINLNDRENSLFCNHFSNSPSKRYFCLAWPYADLVHANHNCCAFIRATSLFCPENIVFRSYSCDIYISFSGESLHSLYSLCADLLMVILLIVTYCKKLLWRALRKVLVYGYSMF